MTTDREMLELAAKAAGIELDWDVPPNSPPWTITGIGEDCGPGSQWNPLTDDGDALRLAIDLKFEIRYTEDENGDRWVSAGRSGKYCIEFFPKASGIWQAGLRTKESKATCRAIVRAAAEIGKDMQS